MTALVRLAGVRLGYGSRTILERVDIEVHPGDFLAIVGPNGSGKTTILRAILGVLAPLAGELTAPRSCGYAPQRRALDPIYPFTVGEIVGMGLQGERGPLRSLRAGDRERIDRALADCGIAALRDRAFRELSGGQQQRALVARALVADPSLLVLDEPTNDLDLSGEHDVMELVASLNRAGRTVVMVSHLLNVVAHYATRVAILHEGRLEVGTTDEVLSTERLSALYGMPVLVADVEGRRAIVPAKVARP